MRLLRPVLFSFLGFCSAIVAYLFSPGQWLNRMVALMLCGVLTADQVCLALVEFQELVVNLVLQELAVFKEHQVSLD